MDPSTAAAPVAPAAAAAPAPPVAAPQTQTAVDAAVSSSPREYREAKRAERAGKPLPAVAVAETTDRVDPAAGAKPGAAAPTPQLSKRQQEINDRAQRAVETATAQLREENDRLKRQLTERPAPAQEPARAPDPVQAPPAAPLEKFPSLDVWAGQKENEGKTFNDYLDDRDTFNADQRDRAQRVDRDFKARAETLTKQSQAFASAMGEAIKAEPDLASKIPPAMRDPQGSTPLSAMSPDQLKTAKFSNLVAEAAFRSAHPAALLKHLHAHQDETIRISQLEQQHGTAAALGALRWLDSQLGTTAAATASPTTPAAPKVKTISAAPASQDVLGKRATTATDPITSAIRNGDTRAYRQQRREERASGLKR